MGVLGHGPRVAEGPRQGLFAEDGYAGAQRGLAYPPVRAVDDGAAQGVEAARVHELGHGAVVAGNPESPREGGRPLGAVVGAGHDRAVLYSRELSRLVFGHAAGTDDR